MYTNFVAKRSEQFPSEMLVRIALGGDPTQVCDEYGINYQEVQLQPHFIRQLENVEQDLMQEGAITRVIAGIGLHKAVENINQKLLTPALLPNGDLVKFTEVLLKVKNDNKPKDVSPAKSGFSIEFNFPDSLPAGTTVRVSGTTHKNPPQEIEVTDVEDDVSEVPVLDEIPDYDESIPDEILNIFNNTKSDFGVDFDD